MKTLLVLTLSAMLSAPGLAQPRGTAAPATPASAPPSDPAEPAVKRSHIEDKGASIDELRVRGEVQRVVVTPKVGTRLRYEILTGNAGRDAFDAAGGSRDAVGKRVWTVLDF